MSRRRNLLILVGILAILTAFLMAAYWPSTLPQVLGKDFAQLKEVQIHLSHVRDNSPSRDLIPPPPTTPPPGICWPCWRDSRYRPVYHNPGLPSAAIQLRWTMPSMVCSSFRGRTAA